MKTEDFRQLIHILLFGLVFLLNVLDRTQMAGLLILFLIITWLLVPRTGIRKYLYRAQDKKYSKGALSYFGSLFLVVLLFPPYAIVAGWGALALGDGLATLVGSRFNSWRLPWSRTASLLGSLAFILVTFLGVWAALSFLRPEFGQSRILTIAGVAALAGAIVESLPWKINDNWAVPIVVALIVYFL